MRSSAEVPLAFGSREAMEDMKTMRIFETAVCIGLLLPRVGFSPISLIRALRQKQIAGKLTEEYLRAR